MSTFVAPLSKAYLKADYLDMQAFKTFFILLDSLKNPQQLEIHTDIFYSQLPFSCRGFFLRDTHANVVFGTPVAYYLFKKEANMNEKEIKIGIATKRYFRVIKF